MICERCFHSSDEGEHGIGLCPFQPRPAYAVVRPDDIPGGVLLEHGLCNPDGSPRRFDSRSAIRRACAEKGLIPWTEVYSEDRTKDDRVRADWMQSGEAQRARRDRVQARQEKYLARERAQAMTR